MQKRQRKLRNALEENRVVRTSEFAAAILNIQIKKAPFFNLLWLGTDH